jgi:hypothetical protein
LLFAEDAGRPLVDVVRERLRFHAPELRFNGGATATVVAQGAALDGIQAALSTLTALLREQTR